MIEDDLDIYYHIINDRWYVSVEDYKKLKERINKVIEYIERFIANGIYTNKDSNYMKLLYNIKYLLKGEYDE